MLSALRARPLPNLQLQFSHTFIPWVSGYPSLQAVRADTSGEPATEFSLDYGYGSARWLSLSRSDKRAFVLEYSSWRNKQRWDSRQADEREKGPSQSNVLTNPAHESATSSPAQSVTHLVAGALSASCRR
jgi:hypothetical protein